MIVSLGLDISYVVDGFPSVEPVIGTSMYFLPVSAACGLVETLSFCCPLLGGGWGVNRDRYDLASRFVVAELRRSRKNSCSREVRMALLSRGDHITDFIFLLLPGTLA